MRKSRVSQNTIELLITLFIAGTSVRSSTKLCGVESNIAIRWHHRFRAIIYRHVQTEHYVFDEAIEAVERYFEGSGSSGKTIVCQLYLDYINVMGMYIQ